MRSCHSAIGLLAAPRCKPGSYVPTAGASECLPCGKNQITLYTGAESESECICEEGSFMCASRMCLPCPEGLYCPRGLGLPQQQGGFWTRPASLNQCDFSVLRCRNEYQCPPGALGTCAAGREGQACNNCRMRHFPTRDGACQACTNADILPAVCVLTLVLGLLCFLNIASLGPNQVSAEAADPCQYVFILHFKLIRCSLQCS